MDSWIAPALAKIYDKTTATIQRIGNDAIPYMAEQHQYRENMATKDIVWWTNGFWGGLLWQLNHYHEKGILRAAALKSEVELDQAFLKYEGLHHDVGFMWLPTAVANYRLNGDQHAYWRARHAADLLAGRYNPAGKYLRSWNRDRAGWVIIDSMINIQLLYWASDVTGDPRFEMMANNHADTVMHHHVRPDGSVAHIVEFDPSTGAEVTTHGGQGAAVGSSWTRGQSWAIYGFALAYRHTHNEQYLQIAKKVAHYFIANVATTDFVPVVDFRAEEPQATDTSAGAIAACGLLEIADQVPADEQTLYRHAATQLLHNSLQRYGDLDPAHDGILTGATTAFHDQRGQDVNLIYGDYYLVEGLLRLLGKDFLLW